MDFEAKGIKVSIDPREQSNDLVLGGITELAEVARERGLILPFGATAVEGAIAPVHSEAPLTLADTKESIFEQVTQTHEGYKEHTDALNSGRRKTNRIEVATPKVFTEAFEDWFTEDTVERIAREMVDNPDQAFDLSAVSNEVLPFKDIKKAAVKFGEDQPYETFVYDPLYEKYSDQDLSGTYSTRGKSLTFSLTSNVLDPSWNGNVSEQRSKFAPANRENSGLVVLSPYQAVGRWFTMRAQGRTLDFNSTYVRHFNLDPKSIGGSLCVPNSYVAGYGKPYLYNSNARGGNYGRVSVG